MHTVQPRTPILLQQTGEIEKTLRPKPGRGKRSLHRRPVALGPEESSDSCAPRGTSRHTNTPQQPLVQWPTRPVAPHRTHGLPMAAPTHPAPTTPAPDPSPLPLHRPKKIPLVWHPEKLQPIRTPNRPPTAPSLSHSYICTMIHDSAFIHPTAVVDPGARIGAGVKIWHFSHIMPDAELGEGCNIGQNVVVSPGVRLGKNVKVQNNVSLYTGVTCDDDVFLGPSCVFTNVINPRSAVNRRGQYAQTYVGRGASIGANATIVCGHDIGEYAFIGAGAVVTKTVAPYALLVGNPARQTGWMSRHGHRLHFDTQGKAQCPEGGDRYSLHNGTVEWIG